MQKIFICFANSYKQNLNSRYFAKYNKRSVVFSCSIEISAPNTHIHIYIHVRVYTLTFTLFFVELRFMIASARIFGVSLCITVYHETTEKYYRRKTINAMKGKKRKLFKFRRQLTQN